ncbi:MAG: 2-oxoglutarate dehydrogenase complex dihydrolipoyllysine-residue succinyltransferase [Proteobacteria bacterium]|nr:2-oxoglutarate dehydrogenase complex dihydrolipoyllysine-residue succinyltransferase [Pseudomonadota bacterium]MBW3618374.1 2-oxoglutarate dehydrogenase complex dihydrolipoyllysine-residue succinyltransferase [Pseudomonadota bacterium]
MSDILVPTLGESVSEATVARWTKKAGEAVRKDEILVELETDKVGLEVAAPADGTLSEIAAEEGATVTPGQVLGRLGAAGAGAGANGAGNSGAQIGGAPVSVATTPTALAPGGENQPETQQATPQEAAALPNKELEAPEAPQAQAAAQAQAATQPRNDTLSPSVQRIVAENGLDPSGIAGSGRDGRITKGDALAALETRQPQAPTPVQAPAAPGAQPQPREAGPREERVKMSRLRQTIARRLKEAQNTAAMLTTFNEVDMTNVMALRNQYKDGFEKRHGVKLGFMSFFVKAAVAALKEIPAVNAEIDGTDIVYKQFYDIGVAVGSDKGLVVPVVRDADQLSFAGVEKTIAALGKQARDGALTIDQLQGGTFTISNGGIYGSLMSTPILNAPQSGILGMHKIQERPMVIGGKLEIRPMMYLALSYDHRIVDGKEAVTFLVRLKEQVEDPERLLLEV